MHAPGRVGGSVHVYSLLER